jgi:HTH-type transcriptional regulator, bacterioopsin transcriptional activator and related proteins
VSRTDIEQFALDSLPVNVAVLDENAVIVATNKAWEEFGRENGLTATTRGVSYLDVCDAADDLTADEVAAGIRGILAGDRTEFSLEYPCHSPDERRWFVMSAAEVTDDGNRYIVVAHMNFTERHERESEIERYEMIVRNIPVIFFAIDPDGTFRLAEGSGLESTGTTNGEIVGQSIYERYEEYPDILEDCLRSLSGESVRTTREFHGTIYDIVFQPVFDADGNVERVIGVAIDVTRRKHHEDALASLSNLTRELLGTETAEEVCTLTVEAAERLLSLPVTIIALYDESTGALRPTARTEESDELPTELLNGDGIAWESFIQNDARFDGETVSLPLGTHGVFVTSVSGDATLDIAELCAAAVESALGRAERQRRLREQEATLRRQNAALERLNELNEGIRRIDRALVEARTREEIEDAVCSRLTSGGPYRFAWIGAENPATGTVVPHESAGIERGYLDALTIRTDDETGDLAGTALRTGRAQVAQDVLRGPLSEQWQSEALKRGYRSSCALPLRYGDAVYGVLSVYSDEPRTFDELERAVLEDVSQTIAYAINAVESKKALTGNEMVELEFDIEDSSVVFVDIAERLDCHVEFTGVVSKHDATVTAFFTVDDAPSDDVCGLASRSLEVVDIERVSSRNDSALFAVTLTDSSFVGTLLDYGAIPETFTVGPLPGSVGVRLSTDADVRTFVEVLQKRFPALELRSRRHRERPVVSGDIDTALAETLTDRQREVLETAYYSGFFDSPRKSTGEEVGRSLDISQPTFQHHLRTAERKLLRRLFES